MLAKLSSRAGIYAVAVSLARYLEDNYKDQDNGEFVTGDRWTQHIFSTLRSSCETELALDATDCFHRGHPSGKGEFLWDFIATQPDLGIILVAESEQQTQIEGLKHDFEKLLYVFAPIRILICKSKTQDDPKVVLDQLTQFCHDCCRNFNQGSVFLVHFSLYGARGSQSYIFQSAGEPRETSTERLVFEPLPPIGQHRPLSGG